MATKSASKKKVTAKKARTREAPTRTAAAKKSPAKKAPANKPPAERAPAKTPAKEAPAKETRATKTPETAADREQDQVAALVEHLLAGFSAKTAARGIAMGMNEPALVKLVGKPEVVHRDEDMGEGRKICTAFWEREISIAGLAVPKESLKVTWTTKPVARGVDSAGLTIIGELSAGRVWRGAFDEVKARLGTIYKKGENKSTWRAPGLALGGTEGFVAVFFYAAAAGRPPMLTINAGVID